MSVRESKKKENRQKILDAAKSVFSEKGYHNTSISDIIRETGLSRGTFYLYFKDKQEIFKKLTAKLYARLIVDISKLDLGPESLQNSYQETLSRGLVSLFSTLRNHRNLVKIVLNSPLGVDPDFDLIVAKYQNDMFASAQGVIQRGIDYGIVTAGNPDLIARLIFGGLKELVSQWLLAGDIMSTETLEEQARQVVAIFEKGIV